MNEEEKRKVIETLQDLKRSCEIGILIIESGLTKSDNSFPWNPKLYDFRIGGFLVKKDPIGAFMLFPL